MEEWKWQAGLSNMIKIIHQNQVYDGPCCKIIVSLWKELTIIVFKVQFDRFKYWEVNVM